jgi:hypothetical protein
MPTTDTQTQRAEHLRELMDNHRCWPFAHDNGPKFRDYDTTYAELAGEYLGIEVDEQTGEEVPIADHTPVIPRFVAITGDETYTMLTPCETFVEAIRAEHGNIGTEYLMNPEGIVDLDTGEHIQTVTVGLSREAFTVLCGLVQPSWMAAETPEQEAEAVNQGGIYTEAWEELRATFPLEHFRKAAQERGEDFYHEEAGL